VVNRVMVVDDDPTVSEVVSRYLERDGFTVERVDDGETALQRALADPPDLVVLDLMLPGLSGLEVCRRLRAAIPVPVVMLTALGEEADRVLGLELGADDYVTKPFSPRELVLRVHSVLRRSAAVPSSEPKTLQDGDLVVDVAARDARLGSIELMLTVREFDLLTFLIRNSGKVLTHRALLGAVWGGDYTQQNEYLRVFIGQLRKKIEPDPSKPRFILTEPWIGYRFNAE